MTAPVPNHRPRILFLARRYPPTIGGIQTHCHALYTRLVQPSPSPPRRAGPPVAFAPDLVPPLLLCGRLVGRALSPRRCRVLRRRGLRVAGSALASFGSSAIHHHRLRPRNDLQKSPRTRADALGSPRLRQGRRHQRKQPPHYRCQRRTRGQVGDHLLRSGAAGVVTRRAGDSQSALCGRTRTALWPGPHPAAFRPPGPPQGHGRISWKRGCPCSTRISAS